MMMVVAAALRALGWLLAAGGLAGGPGSSEAAGEGVRAACPCDLIPGLCELSCCCDPDCTPADYTIFSSCQPGSEPHAEQFCVDASVMYATNTPLLTVVLRNDTRPLFCVLVSNPKRNDLVSPQSVSQEQLSVLTSLYRGNIFMVTSRWSVSAGTWAEGQPILAYFPDSRTLGVLVQPTDLAGGQCTDRNPAGYLRSGSTSCTREVENLVWSCTILPSLRADTYYQGFVLLPTPNITEMGQVQIRPMNGHVAPSPKVEGESCVNVVSEVTYLIQCQGHAGIIDARVAFSFSTVPLGVRRLRQVFHLQFLMSSGNFDAQRRSGNPGYLVGMPVLAFRENSPVLTVPVNTAGGSCSPSARSPVVFGHGLQAGCHHRPDPQHTCRKLQDNITLLLLGPHPPDSLGMLGNASEHHLGDVTRVINDVPKLPDIPCKTICELATSMELQILWANLGPLSNPQSVILGARYRYRTQEVQCSRKTVSLSASVTFVDTSLHPPAPRSSWKFPLYPSPLSHASGQAGVHIPAGAALFICCCCLLSALA